MRRSRIHCGAGFPTCTFPQNAIQFKREGEAPAEPQLVQTPQLFGASAGRYIVVQVLQPALVPRDRPNVARFCRRGRVSDSRSISDEFDIGAGLHRLR
jgi:hypothetical protein